MQISRITLQGAQIYQTSVENTQVVVDKCIKDTLLLISKADELNNDMEAIHKLGDQMCADRALLRTSLAARTHSVTPF